MKGTTNKRSFSSCGGTAGAGRLEATATYSLYWATIGVVFGDYSAGKFVA